MRALSIIFGILLALAGVACLVTPLGTTFALMYFFIILLFVIGIMTLIRCIASKNFGIEFVFSILTVILGVFIVFSPYATFMTEVFMIYMMAAWLVVRGIVGIVVAAKVKSEIGGGMFAVALIFSIITILAGIYSFFHPAFFSGFLGILAGAYFMIAGIDMIVDGIVAKNAD